jgi:hypothetical protein
VSTSSIASESSFGNDITYNGGVFTLQPNRTYRLRGCPGGLVYSGPGGYAIIQWQISSSLSVILSYSSSTNYTADNASGSISQAYGTCEYIYKTGPNPVNASLVIVGQNNLVSIGYNSMLPWADIQVIGGFAAVTNAWSFTSSNIIYYQNGNVGIGTTTPNYTLDISGQVNIVGNLNLNNPITSNNVNVPPYNNQIGNIISGTPNLTNISNGSSGQLGNLFYISRIPPGIWLVNYNAIFDVQSATTVSNIYYGLTSIYNSSPVYGLYKMPQSLSFTTVSYPGFAFSGSYIVTGGFSNGIYLTGNMYFSGSSISGNSNSYLNAIRIA